MTRADKSATEKRMARAANVCPASETPACKAGRRIAEDEERCERGRVSRRGSAEHDKQRVRNTPPPTPVTPERNPAAVPARGPVPSTADAATGRD